MAISTTIQPKYLFRLIAISVVSLVLGLWGVYDYLVRIPRQQELFDHGQVYSQVQKALMSANEGDTTGVTGASEAVVAELEKLEAGGIPDDQSVRWSTELVLFNEALVKAVVVELEKLEAAGTLDDQRAAQERENWAGELLLFNEALIDAAATNVESLKAARPDDKSASKEQENWSGELLLFDEALIDTAVIDLEKLKAAARLDGQSTTTDQESWAGELVLFDEALVEAVVAELEKPETAWARELILFSGALAEAAGRRPNAQASDGYVAAFDLAKQRVNETATIEKPGTFDRITQIAFISCLLMIPYLLWQYLRLKKTVYRLEDDGSLQYPGGTISHDAIADVDMSRWMSKSIAFVVGSDGTRVKLDDYVFKNVDRIVGKLAHEREPTVWQEDARPVKRDDDDDDTIDGAEGDAPAEAETAPKD